MTAPLAVMLWASVVIAQSEGFGGDSPAPGDADYGQLQTQAMKRRLAEDRVRSRYLRREELSILDGIKDIDADLARQRRSLSALQDRCDVLTEAIVDVDETLQATATRLQPLERQLGRRASAMLRLRRTPMSDVLARAGTIVKARRLRDGLRRVMRYDAELVTRTRATASQARRSREDLAARRIDLARTRGEVKEGVVRAEVLREERAALLRAIKKERSLVDRLTAEISRAAGKIERERGVVRGVLPPPPLRSGEFSGNKGRLPWPVAGRVEVTFGKRVDPVSGLIMAQQGLDIRAPFGEPVKAVFHGEVAHVGRVAGFGNLLIIDHDGWYTVYAHLDRTLAPSGVRVKAGDTIGVLGSSDSTKGPYLYFEVRRGRRAVDPLRWLAP